MIHFLSWIYAVSFPATILMLVICIPRTKVQDVEEF